MRSISIRRQIFFVQRCLYFLVFTRLYLTQILIPPEIKATSYLYRHLEDKLTPLLPRDGNNEPKVFVCENFTCQLPVGKVEDLRSLL